MASARLDEALAALRAPGPSPHSSLLVEVIEALAEELGKHGVELDQLWESVTP